MNVVTTLVLAYLGLLVAGLALRLRRRAGRWADVLYAAAATTRSL